MKTSQQQTEFFISIFCLLIDRQKIGVSFCIESIFYKTKKWTNTDFISNQNPYANETKKWRNECK